MKRRGVVLVEILALLILIAAAALIAGQLFISVMRLIHDLPRTEARATLLDSALHQLRRDVYRARACRVAPDGSLEIDGPAPADRVVWRDAGTALVRTAGETPRTWPNLGVQFRFAPQGPLLLVELREGKSPPQTVALPAALALGGAR